MKKTGNNINKGFVSLIATVIIMIAILSLLGISLSSLSDNAVLKENFKFAWNLILKLFLLIWSYILTLLKILWGIVLSYAIYPLLTVLNYLIGLWGEGVFFLF